MAEPAVPRVTRLLGIVTQLEEHGEATFEELGQHFGVSAEVIRADIDTLWCSGLPGYGATDLLDFDGWAYDEGIARLTNSQGVHQVRLAPGEAVALIAALGSIIASGAAPPSAQGALEALGTAVAHAVPITVVPAAAVDPATTGAIEAAIVASMAVDITYVDAQDRRTARTIEPHRLVAIDGVGYVECFCRRARDYRTLRLDRIEGLSPTDSPSEAPLRDATGFSLEPTFEAVVRVARAGRWAFEDLPGAVLELEDEHVLVRFGVANPEVVVARLLAVAPHVVSVEPPELRERLSRAARSVLDAQG